MTDRLKGCWVAFEVDIKEDDAENLLNVIKSIKGVPDVTPSVSDSDDWMNRARIKDELIRKLYNLLKEG